MALKDHSLAPSAAAPDPLDGRLDNLSDEQLMTLRHRLDKKLKLDLAKLNLAEELGLLYRAGQVLLSTVQDDLDTPANQRAQVFNSVSGNLEKIVKQQKIVYDAERLKRFESAFLKVLDALDSTEAKRKFFDLYGEYLKEAETEDEHV